MPWDLCPDDLRLWWGGIHLPQKVRQMGRIVKPKTFGICGQEAQHRVVFLDGRFREACFLKMLKSMTPEEFKRTQILIDDYGRSASQTHRRVCWTCWQRQPCTALRGRSLSWIRSDPQKSLEQPFTESPLARQCGALKIGLWALPNPYLIVQAKCQLTWMRRIPDAENWSLNQIHNKSSISETWIDL